MQTTFSGLRMSIIPYGRRGVRLPEARPERLLMEREEEALRWCRRGPLPAATGLGFTGLRAIIKRHRYSVPASIAILRRCSLDVFCTIERRESFATWRGAAVREHAAIGAGNDRADDTDCV